MKKKYLMEKCNEFCSSVLIKNYQILKTQSQNFNKQKKKLSPCFKPTSDINLFQAICSDIKYFTDFICRNSILFKLVMEFLEQILEKSWNFIIKKAHTLSIFQT